MLSTDLHSIAPVHAGAIFVLADLARALEQASGILNKN
jgi:hypothetical protein